MDFLKESVTVCWVQASYRFTVYHVLYNAANEEEKSYLDKYHSFESKYDSLLGLTLSKYLAGKTSAGRVSLSHNAKGKPYLKEFNGELSITHSNGIAAAVLSASKIGLDLEKRLEETDIELLLAADMFPTAAKRKDLDRSEFTTLWTRMEAYVKMLGCGFLVNPASLFWEGTESGKVKKSQPHFYTASFQQDMVLSICSEKAIDYTLQKLSEDTLIKNQLNKYVILKTP